MAFHILADPLALAPSVPAAGRTAVRGLPRGARNRVDGARRWCVECGRLADAVADGGETRCTCGASALADLACEFVCEEMAELDDALPRRVVPGVLALRRVGSALLGLCLAIAVLGGTASFAFVAWGVYSGALVLSKDLAGLALVSAFSAVLGVFGLHTAVLPMLRHRISPLRRRALRWAGFHSTSRELGPAVVGPIQQLPDEPALQAPLSGRPCLAWELAIRKDDRSDARDGTWLLLERRSSAMRIGELSLAADRVDLDLVREPLELDASDPRMLDALRGRGIDATGLRLYVYESIVPVDAIGTVHATADGGHRLRLR